MLTWMTVIQLNRCWRHSTSIAPHPSSCLYKCLFPHPSLTMFPCPTFTHSYSMTRWEWWSLNLINPCSCWPSVGVGLPSLVSHCCLRSLDTLTGTGRLTLMSLRHRGSLLRLSKVWISTSYIPSLSSSFFLYCLILFTAHFLYVHPLTSSALFSCTADSWRRPSWSKCPVV